MNSLLNRCRISCEINLIRHFAAHIPEYVGHISSGKLLRQKAHAKTNTKTILFMMVVSRIKRSPCYPDEFIHFDNQGSSLS